MLESELPMSSAGSVARIPFHSRPIERSISDGDLSSSSKKKAKHQDDEDPGLFLGPESAPVNPPPIRCSISDGDILSRSNKDKHQDAKDPCGSESAMVNPPFMRSSISDKHHDAEYPSLSLPLPANISVKNTATPRVFNLFIDEPKLDPKKYLDKAWRKLKPAIRSIFFDEPDCFSCTEIFNAVRDAWWAESGEALYKLIQEECGTHISAALQSLEGQCNDAPSVFLPLLVQCWLDFHRKFRFLCSITGGEGQRVGGRTLSEFCRQLFPTQLFLASEVRDKVLSNILVMIKDQRLGKSVDMTQLDHLLVMCNGASFHNSRLLEKPFLECAAEFYAAEATQVLEQSDLPQYLKHVERRLREEKEKCVSLYYFAKFKDELIEIVERELLGVHASAILEKGFEKLMDGRCGDDLHRMYTLFSEANLLGHLNGALSSYILKTGRKILAEGSSLAGFKDSVDRICTSYFFEDDSLEKTVEQCFKDLGLPWKDRFASDFI